MGDFIAVFLELSIILFIYYESFGEENIKNIEKIIRIVSIGLLMSLLFIRIQGLNSIMEIVIMVTTFILIISYSSKKPIEVVTIEIIVCYIEMFLIEMVVTGAIYLLHKTAYVSNKLMLMLMLPGFLVACAVVYANKRIGIRDRVSFFYNDKNIILIFFIPTNTIIYFIAIKVLIEKNILIDNVIIQFIILAIVLISINIMYILKVTRLINDKKNLELKNTYNPLLNEVIENLKEKEHEYKNHLNVLYNIAEIEDGNDIKEHISKYIDNIKNDSNLEKVMYIDNVVLKAIIYNLLKEAEKLNIRVNLSIKSKLNNLLLDDLEITTVMSNLINNAIEALKEVDKKELEIIIDEVNGTRIMVKNYAPNISNEDIQHIFEKGISTKGENRGYGLYNVRKIVKKYKGEIQLNLEEEYLIINIIFE